LHSSFLYFYSSFINTSNLVFKTVFHIFYSAHLLLQGLQCVTYSMVMELYPPAWRTLAGCVVEAFWAGGRLITIHVHQFRETCRHDTKHWLVTQRSSRHLWRLSGGSLLGRRYRLITKHFHQFRDISRGVFTEFRRYFNFCLFFWRARVRLRCCQVWYIFERRLDSNL